MGKFEKKKAPKSRKGLLLGLIATVILAVLAAVFLFPGTGTEISGGTASETETPETAPEAASTEIPGGESPKDTDVEDSPSDDVSGQDIPAGKGVSYPLVLEEGRLTIESLFQFEGINPDCANREGDRIAAIIIRNTSEKYLESAELTLTLADGSNIAFAVTHLPAGKGALAFSLDNAELADNVECVGIKVQTAFGEPPVQEGLKVEADGLSVTVTNETQQTIEEIEVYCHGVFGLEYFGGITYVYTIAQLSPGQSETITAADCFLGLVEVVRFEAKEDK